MGEVRRSQRGQIPLPTLNGLREGSSTPQLQRLPNCRHDLRVLIAGQRADVRLCLWERVHAHRPPARELA